MWYIVVFGGWHLGIGPNEAARSLGSYLCRGFNLLCSGDRDTVWALVSELNKK